MKAANKEDLYPRRLLLTTQIQTLTIVLKIFHHRSDEETVFRRLVREYQEPLYWHIRTLVGGHEDAEDTLQEAFIRVHRNLSQLREEKSERAWLYRIATNEALRHLEQRRVTEDIDDTLVADSCCADHDTDYDALNEALHQAVMQLPPRQRGVFSMRYYDDLSYDEIAAVTGSNVKAVTANYHTAKEKIKKYLLAL